MFTFRVNVKSTIRVSVPGFTEEDMREFGELAIDVMTDRISRAVNVYDASAKPLAVAYARHKQRQGASGLRDLRLTGEMLASLKVSGVSDRGVRVGFGDRQQYLKAHVNQEREPMFGLSEEDRRQMMQSIRVVFHNHTQHSIVLIAGVAVAGIAAYSATSTFRSQPVLVPRRSNVILMTPRTGAAIVLMRAA